jgi:hypothetical protein
MCLHARAQLVSLEDVPISSVAPTGVFRNADRCDVEPGTSASLNYDAQSPAAGGCS